jgi:hypothetical protein
LIGRLRAAILVCSAANFLKRAASSVSVALPSSAPEATFALKAAALLEIEPLRDVLRRADAANISEAKTAINRQGSQLQPGAGFPSMPSSRRKRLAVRCDQATGLQAALS